MLSFDSIRLLINITLWPRLRRNRQRLLHSQNSKLDLVPGRKQIAADTSVYRDKSKWPHRRSREHHPAKQTREGN